VSAVANVGYVPGALTAVAGESCLALVEAAPDSPAAAWIWQQAGRGASAQALLAGLHGAGFEGVGGFALLDRPAAGPLRLFCRGAVAATVVGATVVGETEVGGTVVGGTAAEGTGAAATAFARIDGVGLLTWREHVVAADAERIYLGQPPDDGALWLPTAAGVLLAGCVIVDLAQTAPPAAADADAAVVEAPAQPDATEVADSAGRPDRASESAIRQEDAVAAMPDPPASDGWFQPSGASRDPDAASSAPTPDAPPVIARPWDPPSGSSNGQWAAPPLDGRPGPTAAPPERERPVAQPESSPDRIGPDVPALICPAGHVNPPSEAVCRQCGAALPADPVIVARPVLGVLRLSTGDVLTLDRDVVLGRNPPADVTGANGEGRPHVVKLPSADGQISRAHLRVTLSGWQVLVTDLNSTNGSRITLPGREQEQLPPGVLVPISPGTVIALAEGINFRFEDAGVS
jgi:hypothetical protein